MKWHAVSLGVWNVWSSFLWMEALSKPCQYYRRAVNTSTILYRTTQQYLWTTCSPRVTLFLSSFYRGDVKRTFLVRFKLDQKVNNLYLLLVMKMTRGNKEFCPGRRPERRNWTHETRCTLQQRTYTCWLRLTWPILPHPLKEKVQWMT